MELIVNKKNNCVLVCLKEITRKSDEEIFAAVRRNNYKDDHGMYQHDYHRAAAELGLALATPVRPTEQVAAGPGASWAMPKPMTLGKLLLKKLRKGTYMVRTAGHVFAVRDGKLLDHNFLSRSALRRNVVDYTEVLNAPEVAKRGLLKLVRRRQRQPGTARYFREIEMNRVFDRHGGVIDKATLLRECKHAVNVYGALELRMDLQRGNIVEI